MSGTATPSVRDQIIADAKSLPDLINTAKSVDPQLAASLTPKALLASKSPAGTLASGIVAWLVPRYGLGWDQATCDLVAGAAVLAGGYAMRYITTSPISGILKT